VAFTYQWVRGMSNISGATSSAYTLVAADVGSKISVRVTGSLAGYTTATRQSAQTAVVAAAGYSPVMSAFALSPDLSGDGLGEVLAVDAAGRLRLFKGSATGFGASHVFPGPAGLSGSRVYGPGDWSNDGKADLAVIDGAGDLYCYRGRGDGSFFKGVKCGRGWGAYELAAGADLTGDKYADIVGLDTATRKLYLYKGLGGGGFLTKRQIGAGW
jgi:hypothetical protein